jgi:hypothetical protein
MQYIYIYIGLTNIQVINVCLQGRSCYKCEETQREGITINLKRYTKETEEKTVLHSGNTLSIKALIENLLT